MNTVIFDFGNVVAFFDHWQACRQLAALADNPVSDTVVFEELFSTSLESDFDCGKISSREFIDRLKNLFSLKASDNAIINAWCNIFRPNEEVLSILPDLKKINMKLLLASNTNELHFQWIIKQFATPLACFDDFILSYEIGCRKPAMPFFEKCVETARVAPRECIYVDDRADFVSVATALRMSGIVYQPDIRLADTLRDLGIELL